MANFTTTKSNDECLTIEIEGRFDYNSIPEFRSLYESSEELPRCFVIDMKATDTIDSSALGMLLMLRRHAGGDKSKVVIKNLNQDLRRIFAVSKLDTMFELQ